MVWSFKNRVISILPLFFFILTIAACSKDANDELKALKNEKTALEVKISTAEKQLKEAEETLKKAQKLETDAKTARDATELELGQRESNILLRAQALNSAKEDLEKAQLENNLAKVALETEKKELENSKAIHEKEMTTHNANYEAKLLELKEKEKAINEKITQSKENENKIATDLKQAIDLQNNFRKETRLIRELMASKYSGEVFDSYLKDEPVPVFIGYNINGISKSDALNLREKISKINTAAKYDVVKRLIPNGIESPTTPSKDTLENITDTYLVEATKENIIDLRDSLREDPRVNLVIIEPVLKVSISRRLTIKDRNGDVLQDGDLADKVLENKDFKKINLNEPFTYVEENQLCKEMKSDCIKGLLETLDKTKVTSKYDESGVTKANQVSYREYLKMKLKDSIHSLDSIIKSRLTSLTLGMPFSLSQNSPYVQVESMVDTAKSAINLNQIENQNFIGNIELSYNVQLLRERAKDDFPINPELNKAKNNKFNNFVHQTHDVNRIILPITNFEKTRLPTPNSFEEHRNNLVEILKVIE